MQHWALTDVGVVRAQNQDTYQIEELDRNTVLCVVCDGMGGANSGNVASVIAADVFTREVKETWSAKMDMQQMELILRSALNMANLAVYEQATKFEEYRGMGTTIVALLLHGKQATLLNVGDSRGYLLDDAGIIQITTDHSLVQMMIDRGELTPEQAKVDPKKNVITRAVGTDAHIQADVFHREVKKGSNFLLCTDGLTNLVDDQEILFEVAYGENKDQCCQRLIDLAKKRGAPDNVTCLLVTV